MRNPEYNGRRYQRRNFLSVFFRGAGWAFLAGGLIYGVVVFGITSHSVRATGYIVKFVAVRKGKLLPLDAGLSDTVKSPLIQFKTASGSIIEFIATATARSSSYTVGEQVPVAYNPADPKKCRIDAPWRVWSLPIILVGLGVVFIILASLVSIGAGDMPRRLTPR